MRAGKIAVKGCNHGVCRKPVRQDFRRSADFSLSGKKGEQRAVFLCKEATDGLRRKGGDVLAGRPLGMANVDGKGPAAAFDRRCVAEHGADALDVERRRHDQQFQVFPERGLDVDGERQPEIAVERTFVELVEDDEAEPGEFRLVEHHAAEDAFGYDLDSRLGRDAGVEPRAVADGFSDFFPEQPRHLAGAGAGGEPARLEHDDASGSGPGLVQQVQRNQGRLAGARRGGKHGGSAVRQCG